MGVIKRVVWGASLLLAGLLLVGCQKSGLSGLPAEAIQSVVEATEPATELTTTQAATTAQAVVAAAPTTLALSTWTPSPSPFPTWTPSPSPVAAPTRTPTWTLTPEPTATASPEPTPAPTFTPPPPDPALVVAGRYVIERPIPADYTNWTDRFYPYGSTRGGTLSTHHGVEFVNPEGVPVVAAGAGMVVTAGADNEMTFGPQANFYGLLVAIRHDEMLDGQPVYTVYGHLSEVLVSEGQAVAVGDLIGRVGGTGVANGGAHLHFEVRLGENSYDATRNPDLWLRPFAGQGTIAGRLLWPDGSPVYGATLLVQRADNPRLFVNRYVTTYADDSVHPDGVWGENFAVPDVDAGPYEVILRDAGGGATLSKLVWVYAGQTSLVTMQMSAPAAEAP